MTKNKLTERIGNTVKVGALAAAVAMPNVADANLVKGVLNPGETLNLVQSFDTNTGLYNLAIDLNEVNGKTNVGGLDIFGLTGYNSISNFSGDTAYDFGNLFLNDDNGGTVNSQFFPGDGNVNSILNSITPFNIGETGTGLAGFYGNLPAESFNWEVVSNVPIPATAYLFGSALIGLGGLQRRKETLKKDEFFFYNPATSISRLR